MDRPHPFLQKNSDALTDFALIQTMRETIMRKIERKKRGKNGWVDHSFEDPRGAEMYDLLAPMLEGDWFFNDFCAAVIKDMCKYEFWEYPSVNLKNESEVYRVNIVRDSNNKTSYKLLAQVNLMDHTRHVIESCQIYFDEQYRRRAHAKKLIAVAAFFHDVGKHYPMMRDEGIIDDSLELHEYKHHVFSSNYFNQKAVKVMGVDCKPMAFELDQISYMIYEHHGLKTGCEPDGVGSLDLIEIDRMARTREIHELTTGINTRKNPDAFC
jgi:hypothetical protein